MNNRKMGKIEIMNRKIDDQDLQRFSAWLTQQFRDWEAKSSRKQNVSAFARYLGVRQPSLNRWMQGDNPPDEGNIKILAQKLGDEVYDIINLPRPYSTEEEWQKLLSEFSPEIRQAKMQEAIRILEENGWRKK